MTPHQENTPKTFEEVKADKTEQEKGKKGKWKNITRTKDKNYQCTEVMCKHCDKQNLECWWIMPETTHSAGTCLKCHERKRKCPRQVIIIGCEPGCYTQEEGSEGQEGGIKLKPEQQEL